MGIRGPRTWYRPKESQCETVKLTRFAKDILHACAARCDISRADAIETLLRLHGGEVGPELFVVAEDEERVA